VRRTYLIMVPRPAPRLLPAVALSVTGT
jgi:hypothetical protein